MPIQSCGQSVSAPCGKAGATLNAHTGLPAKRQRSAREAIYRNRPIENTHSTVESERRFRVYKEAPSFCPGPHKHSTAVQNTPLLLRSPHVCMKYCIHPEGQSCSGIGRVLVLIDPPVHST